MTHGTALALFAAAHAPVFAAALAAGAVAARVRRTGGPGANRTAPLLAAAGVSLAASSLVWLPVENPGAGWWLTPAGVRWGVAGGYSEAWRLRLVARALLAAAAACGFAAALPPRPARPAA